MRRICYSLVVCLLLVAPVSAQDTLRALFIGNSHTYMNDLPRMFANLSLAGGHIVVTDMSAPGGYTLLQHTTNQITLQKIAMGAWDYVSLQEHSLYPVIDYYRYGSYYPAARTLDSLITNLGQRTLFYMTWGRPLGGQWSIGGHYSIYFEDFFQMQDTVSAATKMISDELGAGLIPAGNAWATVRHIDSTYNFWQIDTIHANLKGTYIVACVFYATLFHASPVGLQYFAGLTPDTALFLQQAAEAAVLDIADDGLGLPRSFEVFQNYPNPFNAQTLIRYMLPEPGDVQVDIYDLLGRKINTLWNGYQSSGMKTLTWDGTDSNHNDVSSGIYFYRIRANGKSETRPLSLIK